MSPDFAAQSPYGVRLEWGLNGVMEVANRGGVAVIVDVLSFSSCVDIVCSRGAKVLPYRFKDHTAEGFARMHGAVLASSRGSGGFSLSPQSLLEIESGTKLVLPSPNGSTLSLACTASVVLAGCLRNAAAVAAFARAQAGAITLVAAGERWPDGSLRPSVEDLIGAGAIAHHLEGAKSPEARIAETAFLAAQADLAGFLERCASGVELISRGFVEDVGLAAQLSVSGVVPILQDGAYTSASR